MKIIGLTGGIGSGKSTVAGFLSKLGAEVINADKIGHGLLESDRQTREQVIAAFGQSILNADGSIDRRKLGKIVFNNHASLSRLNRIMHPHIYRMIKTRLIKYREQGVKTVVIEAPLLIEAGWNTIVDRVWVVAADRDIILTRLGGKGFPEDEAIKRIHSQIPDKERLKGADIIISNNLSLEELEQKVLHAWQGI